MTLSQIVYIVWVSSEIILSLLFRSARADRIRAGQQSIGWLWLYITAAVAIAVTAHYSINTPIAAGNWTEWAGSIVSITGIAIRITAIFSLGRMFTVDVAIPRGHRLKTDGIYRHIRHPAYGGLLLCFYGLGISLNNWISLLILVLVTTSIFLQRIEPPFLGS